MRFIKGFSAVVQRQQRSQLSSTSPTSCFTVTGADATKIEVITSQLHENLRTVLDLCNRPYTQLTIFSGDQVESTTSDSDLCNPANAYQHTGDKFQFHLGPTKDCNLNDLDVNLVNSKSQHSRQRHSYTYRHRSQSNSPLLDLSPKTKLLESSGKFSRHYSSQTQRGYLAIFGQATKMSEAKPEAQTTEKVHKESGATVTKTSVPEQKVDIRQVMAAEDEWISAPGGHRVHAWSISGVESCIVAEISGTRLAFDMGYATRPSIQCAHVFISHGHIDHVAALVKHAAHRSLFSLPPATYYIPPHLEEPLRAMADSISQLHGGDEKFCNLKLKTISTGETVEVTKSIKVLAFQTVHRVPSQGYIVYRTRKCLRAEYVGLPGPEIGALVKDGVDIHEVVTAPELAYTGDTTFEVFLNPPAEDLLRVRTLITESTYIDDERDKLGRGGIQRARERGHSHIQELIDNEQLFEKVEQIVLVHFSDKYSVRYIRRRTEELLSEGLRNKVALGITMKQTLG